MSSSTDLTYHLEMRSPVELVPRAAAQPIQVTYREGDVAFSREMYLRVGEQWAWNDRRQWSQQQWQAHYDQGTTRTYAGEVDGELIGYFELDTSTDTEVEIIYFGLLPHAIGRGLGGGFLTACIQAAWAIPGTERVWVHTCTNDHQHALQNYQARGFTLFHTQDGCH